MRKALGVIVLGMALALTGRAYAAAPATTQSTSAAIEALVAQLSSDDWKVRQNAQDRLVEMGDAVVPGLQQLVRESQDEEVRTRAEAALKQIEADNKAAPTLITMHLKDASAQTVLAELNKQAKVNIAVWPPLANQPDATKVTIDVDRKPFWLVVREFCEKARYSPMQMGQGGQITLQRGPDSWGRVPFMQKECFFVTADSANRTHNVDFSNPQQIQNHFYVQFKVLVDPKLRVLQGPGVLKLEEVIDDKGNSLIPNTNFGESYNSWGSWMWNVSAQLQYQPNLGSKIAVFRAKARFLVQSKGERWEIDDVLNAKDKEKTAPSNTKYIFKGLSKVANGYQAQIVVRNAGNVVQGRNPMVDVGTLQQCIQLVDAAGRSYSSGGLSGGGGVAQLTYSLTFNAQSPDGQKLGAPAKLIWDIPLEVKEISIPIEFKDLPIP